MSNDPQIWQLDGLLTLLEKKRWNRFALDCTRCSSWRVFFASEFCQVWHFTTSFWSSTRCVVSQARYRATSWRKIKRNKAHHDWEIRWYPRLVRVPRESREHIRNLLFKQLAKKRIVGPVWKRTCSYTKCPKNPSDLPSKSSSEDFVFSRTSLNVDSRFVFFLLILNTLTFGLKHFENLSWIRWRIKIKVIKYVWKYPMVILSL